MSGAALVILQPAHARRRAGNGWLIHFPLRRHCGQSHLREKKTKKTQKNSLYFALTHTASASSGEGEPFEAENGHHRRRDPFFISGLRAGKCIVLETPVLHDKGHFFQATGDDIQE